MKSGELERCLICKDPTGKAGKSEDSLYCESCGRGPFCDAHFMACGKCAECCCCLYT